MRLVRLPTLYLKQPVSSFTSGPETYEVQEIHPYITCHLLLAQHILYHVFPPAHGLCSCCSMPGTLLPWDLCKCHPLRLKEQISFPDHLWRRAILPPGLGLALFRSAAFITPEHTEEFMICLPDPQNHPKPKNTGVLMLTFSFVLDTSLIPTTFLQRCSLLSPSIEAASRSSGGGLSSFAFAYLFWFSETGSQHKLKSSLASPSWFRPLLDHTLNLAYWTCPGGNHVSGKRGLC